jgi:hypothetical protein
MAMWVTEVDTFIEKFKHLWQSGLHAHLDLGTHGIQAWVGLRVHLGHAPLGPLYKVQLSFPRNSRNSPSRQRRRDKRASSRQHNQASEKETAEKQMRKILR